jgi:hypothetical protein
VICVCFNQGGYAITPDTTRILVKGIAPKEYQHLNLGFAYTVYWQDSVPHHVVADVFRLISTTVRAKGLTYREEHMVRLLPLRFN